MSDRRVNLLGEPGCDPLGVMYKERRVDAPLHGRGAVQIRRRLRNYPKDTRRILKRAHINSTWPQHRELKRSSSVEQFITGTDAQAFYIIEAAAYKFSPAGKSRD